MLRVATIHEEAVDRAKMEFPGTYNRKGQLIEDAVEAVDGGEEGEESLEQEAPGDPPDDPLALLEEEFPYLLGS